MTIFDLRNGDEVLFSGNKKIIKNVLRNTCEGDLVRFEGENCLHIWEKIKEFVKSPEKINVSFRGQVLRKHPDGTFIVLPLNTFDGQIIN